MASDEEWRNLLDSSANLSQGASGPRINRTLKGIEKEAHRLSSSRAHHVPATQLKDFAARAGVDLSHQRQYISNIESLSVQQQRRETGPSSSSHRDFRQTIPLISGAVHPTNNMDLGHFLRYHHELVISSTIQQCSLLSARRFRKKYTAAMHREWDSTKMDILGHLGCNQDPRGLHQNGQLPDLSLLHNRSSMEAVRPPLTDDFVMTEHSDTAKEKEAATTEAFGKIICDLSKFHRSASAPMVDFEKHDGQITERDNVFAPIAQFAVSLRAISEEFDKKRASAKGSGGRAVSGGGGESAPSTMSELVSLWQFSSALVLETGLNNERACYLKEAEYLRHRDRLGLSRLLANAARRFLERQYLDLIERAVDKNKNFAKRGGRPGRQFLIKAFIRLKYQNGTMIPSGYKRVRLDGEVFALWPLIYHSLRCGDIDSCLYFARFDPAASLIAECLGNLRERTFVFEQQAVSGGDISAVIELFERCPVALDEALWRRLDGHFKQHIVKKSSDPFQVAVYVVVGRLFVEEVPLWDAVMNRMEDFLWFKLSTLYFEGAERPKWVDTLSASCSNPYIPSLSMAEFQAIIKQEIGPSSFSNRFLFVHALLLSQQFEDAVEFLQCLQPLHAVHLGVCLNHYGLLRPQSRAHSNLMAAVSKFVASFKKTRCDRLFHYLFLVRREEALCEFLCEPNVPLRAAVVGKVGTEHISISNSLLFRFCGLKRFLEICRVSADRAHENGEIEHCILMQVLCGDFNLSALICIKLLCSHITDQPGNPSKRFIVKMAKDIFGSNQRLKRDQSFHELSSIAPSCLKPIDVRNRGNLICAIHFADFYDYLRGSEEGDHSKALSIIADSKLIPVQDEVVMAAQTQSMECVMKPFKERTLRMDSALQKFVGDICVAVMQILSLQFQVSRRRQQHKEAQHVSRKSKLIYDYFNRLESHIKPIGAGDDTAQNISNYYYRTRLD